MKIVRLHQISKDMASQAPVFIVGEARSGTTILYRLLQKHSSFKPLELNLSETKILSYTNRAFLFTYSPKDILAYMLNNMEIYQRFVKTIHPIQVLHRYVNFWPNTQLSTIYTWWWCINFNHILLRVFFYYAQQARGCRRIIEKTPIHLKNVTKLLTTFPHGKLLYIYRHPIDVYTSYKKRDKIEHAEWTDISPEYFCRKYQAAITRALSLSDQKKPFFLLICYEKLTKNPEKEMRRICKFLHEPYEDEILHEETTPSPVRWEIDPYLFGKLIPRTKNWKEYISFKDAHYIENQLNFEMKRLNYHQYTG